MKHAYLTLCLLIFTLGSLPRAGAQSLPVTATAADAGLSEAAFAAAIQTLSQAVRACRSGQVARLGWLSLAGGSPPESCALPAGLTCYSLTPIAPPRGGAGPAWLALLHLPRGQAAPDPWPWQGPALTRLKTRQGRRLILEHPEQFVAWVLVIRAEQVRLVWP
ncbi:MAG: hypothetical protein D6722_04705 [Bacteroidetes bacterium]|nr:MAG: hypothetical protein D6722_04705 [Bacteroidota bacterium]